MAKLVMQKVYGHLHKWVNQLHNLFVYMLVFLIVFDVVSI